MKKDVNKLRKELLTQVEPTMTEMLDRERIFRARLEGENEAFRHIFKLLILKKDYDKVNNLFNRFN